MQTLQLLHQALLAPVVLRVAPAIHQVALAKLLDELGKDLCPHGDRITPIGRVERVKPRLLGESGDLGLLRLPLIPRVELVEPVKTLQPLRVAFGKHRCDRLRGDLHRTRRRFGGTALLRDLLRRRRRRLARRHTRGCGRGCGRWRGCGRGRGRGCGCRQRLWSDGLRSGDMLKKARQKSRFEARLVQAALSERCLELGHRKLLDLGLRERHDRRARSGDRECELCAHTQVAHLFSY